MYAPTYADVKCNLLTVPCNVAGDGVSATTQQQQIKQLVTKFENQFCRLDHLRDATEMRLRSHINSLEEVFIFRQFIYAHEIACERFLHDSFSNYAPQIALCVCGREWCCVVVCVCAR